MTRVETGPGWELRCGDCLDPVTGLASLADKSVDHVITDPPYEAEAHERGKRQGPGNGSGPHERGKVYQRTVDEEFSFSPISEEQRAAIGSHAGRIAGRVVVFCQVEAAMAWRSSVETGGLIYRRTIPWVKPDAMPSLHGRWPGQAFEAIVFAQAPGAPPCPIGGKARYYEVTRRREGRDERAHPTVKPLELMLQIVADFTDPGDLICDPFAGSGTTGVACLRLGRRFIGWERDERYWEIAVRRLSGLEARPRPEQPSLFGDVA